MVDILFAFYNFTISEDTVSTEFNVLNDLTGNLLVGAILKIDVVQKWTTQGTDGVVSRHYRVLVQYGVGTSVLNFRVFKLDTTSNDLFTGVLFNENSERATLLPMIMIPSGNENGGISYDVIMPSTGSVSIVARTIRSARLTIGDDTDIDEVAITGATTINYSATSLVEKKGGTSVYDMCVGFT